MEILSVVTGLVTGLVRRLGRARAWMWKGGRARWTQGGRGSAAAAAARVLNPLARTEFLTKGTHLEPLDGHEKKRPVA